MRGSGEPEGHVDAGVFHERKVRLPEALDPSISPPTPSPSQWVCPCRGTPCAVYTALYKPLSTACKTLPKTLHIPLTTSEEIIIKTLGCYRVPAPPSVPVPRAWGSGHRRPPLSLVRRKERSSDRPFAYTQLQSTDQ